MEWMILIAQAVSLSFIAAWLSVGVLENLRHPFLNESITSEVLEMTRLRRDYPEAYAEVAHRRITSVATRRFMFRLIVVGELIASMVLWIGVTVLMLSAIGQFDTAIATAVALIGALLFTSVWAGFLIAGNWWCYWFGHEGAQNTHFQMTLWGMANMILLVSA